MDNIRLWIWFQLVFGPANPRVWSILNRFNGIRDAYSKIKSGKFNALTQRETNAVLEISLDQADYIIEYCNQKGYNIVTYEHESYPYLLRNIYNAPLVLYCMGDLSVLSQNISISVVGTRKPSKYSIKVAQRLCSELAKMDVILVSGFALGIDSIVHQSALKNKTPTIAVLGCGLDADYPRQNTPIKDVIAHCGAVISEYLPKTEPKGANFPLRNRIISGLSAGTLIVEADNRSGALITANCAIEQGRDVFCVPPTDIFDNRYAGVIKYLRDGAIPTFSHLDIVYEYYTTFSHKINTADMTFDYFDESVESSIYLKEKQKQTVLMSSKVKTKKASMQIENFSEENISFSDINEEDIDENLLKIIRLIQHGVNHADDIAEELQIDVQDLFEQLTELEISGYVRALPGKIYDLTR